MKQIYKNLLTTVMALTLAVTFAALRASASDASGFDCFLIADEGASIPAVTFTYDIAPGEADANATPAVKAGVGSPTIGTAEFTGGETTYTSVQSGDAMESLASGKKYAKKTVSVDFSGVTFSETGVYRYVITQDDSVGGDTFNYDTQVGDGGTAGTRYLDVYVVQGESAFEISAYVLHKTISDASNEDKSTGFVNELAVNATPAAAYAFTFSKAVAGTSASQNKYFKFTLSLGNLTAGSTYLVNLNGAESAPVKTFVTSYDSMSNPDSVQADDSGAVSVDFYLKHGQYITVQGLPAGFTYELSEVCEDYDSAPGISSSYPDNVTNFDGVHNDVRTGFTNTRNGVVPTGVLLTVAPFVVGLFLFGALFFYMMARKRRRD